MSNLVGSTVFKLNNGFTISVFASGTQEGKPGDLKAGVGTALNVGYRQIDGAPIHGNEHEVGEGLNSKINEVSCFVALLWIRELPKLNDKNC